MRTALETIRQRKHHWWMPILICYCASLAMPAVFSYGIGGPSAGSSGAEIMGYEMLLKLPQVLMAPSWWANPLFFVGLVLYMRDNPRAAIFCAFGALLLAALVLFIGAFPPDQFQWSHLRFGYYLWLLSMVELVVAVCVQLFSATLASGDSQ